LAVDRGRCIKLLKVQVRITGAYVAWTAKVEIEALSSNQFRSPAASSPAGGASRAHRGVGALFDWQGCGP
jgi:hypothetical protein